MKKICAGIFLLVLLVSCQQNKKNSVASRDTLSRDSTDIFLPADSLDADSSNYRDGDELFDDFIFNFASDDKYQLNRISFPLPYRNLDRTSDIARNDWKYDELFAADSYYTLIFDRERDLDLISDTTLNAVQFEWIYFADRIMRSYQFNRIDGDWLLQGIVRERIPEPGESGFIRFFTRFSTDSLFQNASVREPLTFVTTDPDDDFSIIETTLPLNQWHAFKPDLPVIRMSNINYGQVIRSDSRNKIVILKGIGNGFSNTLYFKRKGKSWELYKFEDTSN